jgi:serine phosphatase RsbU (regulator of sigma subunit)
LAKAFKYPVLLYFIFACLSGTAQKYSVDSILRQAERAPNDSVRVAEYHKAFFLTHALGDFRKSDSITGALLALTKKISYPRGEVVYLSDKGQLLQTQGKNSEAIEYFLKALKLSEEHNFPFSAANAYNEIGLIHFSQEEYDKALDYYLKSVDILRKNNIEKGLDVYYNNIGNVYYIKKDYEQALHYYNISLDLTKKSGKELAVANFMNNVGSLYLELKNYDKAMEYFTGARKIQEKAGSKYNLIYSLLNQAEVYIYRKELEKAEKHIVEALEMAQELNVPEALRDSHLAYSQLHAAKNEADKAIESYKTYITYRDSMISRSRMQEITAKEMNFEFSKKELMMKAENDKQAIQIAADRKRNQLILLFIIIGASIAGLFTFFLYKRYRLTEKQKKVIEIKSTEIIHSINYAQRLQGALLLPETEVAKHFEDIFILYKPRDIVSGDFYWFSETEENRVIAVADCTGHGVPGALMSMLGFESLENIALRKNILSTSDALKALDKKITETLNKSSRSFRDGMDIALCAFSKTENKLLFSGANRPLLHISDGVLTEYAPDKNTIGGDIDNVEKSYTTKTIHYRKGDTFYLFTDGYADQFGMPAESRGKQARQSAAGKKFKYRNLQKTLVNISGLPLAEQKKALEKTFEDWRGPLEQLDDVCIIGIRV